MIIAMVMMHLLTDAAESDDGMRYIEVRDAIVSIPGNVTRRPQLVTRSFRPSQPLADVLSAALHQQAQCPQAAQQNAPSPGGQIIGWLSTSTGDPEPGMDWCEHPLPSSQGHHTAPQGQHYARLSPGTSGAAPGPPRGRTTTSTGYPTSPSAQDHLRSSDRSPFAVAQ
jgi:hypothetical protein